MDEEKQRLNKQATLKILGAMGIALVIRLGTRTLLDGGSSSVMLAVVLLVIQLGALCLFVWGCADYARSKGYSPWLGFIGLFGCIGLIVLAFLKDKCKPAVGSVVSDTNYTRDPNRY